MITQTSTKAIDYIAYGKDGEDTVEVFTIKNSFDEDEQFQLNVSSSYVTLDELKEVKKIVDKAIKEHNKVF